MRRLLVLAGLLLLGFWWLSRPLGLSPEDVPRHAPDLANGERMFNAGGCGSCHGKVVDGELDQLVMAGGMVLDSPVGRFHVPNITPHAEAGIGGWSELDFLNAMRRGVSPDGRHYYPAFPYTSYAKMNRTDLLDLKAWLDQMPQDANQVADHELGFPYSINRGIGLWKRLFLDDAPVIDIDRNDGQLDLGRYLVEGPGHCGECHTPRNFAQAMDTSRWLGGAPDLEGDGRVPNITTGRASFADWSEDDIAYYLEAGVDPDFDVVGGSMVAVQAHLALLDASDREAIAAYLKAVPGVE